MTDENITLEILVRSGNTPAVKQFCTEQKYSLEKHQENTTEAMIYAVLNEMRKDDCGINPNWADYFENTPINQYLTKTNNADILMDILDVLIQGTRVEMETYAQILPIEFLHVEAFSAALRSNLDKKNVKAKLSTLVQTGYQLLFTPCGISAEDVTHYFSILHPFRDFINPFEMITNALTEFADYNCTDIEFVTSAITSMIQLTDKQTISRIVYKNLDDKSLYKHLVKQGIIDAITKSIDTSIVPVELVNLVRDYARFPSNDITPFKKAIGKIDAQRRKEYVARGMAQWLADHNIKPFMKLVQNDPDGKFYDKTIACEAIANVLTSAVQQKEYALLTTALALPEQLVDPCNKNLLPFITAYRISKKHAGEQQTE